MARKWYDATVSRVEQATEHTRRYWLTLPDGASFNYEPGQFVTLDLPIHEKRRHRLRSYSIADAPSGDGEIELCIVRLPGGKGTQYLFEEVSTGSSLRFKGPGGVFTLPKDLATREIVMVCTGTGVAPFRSMLQHIEQEQLACRHIHLIFGTRCHGDVLYREEFEQMAERLPFFEYSIALSRETRAGCTPGYVHGIYEARYSGPAADRHFYLCGWSRMIDEAVVRLADLGYTESQVHYERYG